MNINKNNFTSCSKAFYNLISIIHSRTIYFRLTLTILVTAELIGLISLGNKCYGLKLFSRRGDTPFKKRYNLKRLQFLFCAVGFFLLCKFSIPIVEKYLISFGPTCVLFSLTIHSTTTDVLQSSYANIKKVSYNNQWSKVQIRYHGTTNIKVNK